MKITGIIPARYQSARWEGKVLADLEGHPMIGWVYRQAVAARERGLSPGRSGSEGAS
jgi:3-deoxy-manno-octulosonate cytidylyltransferase (CMP-KDO synthetase)